MLCEKLQEKDNGTVVLKHQQSIKKIITSGEKSWFSFNNVTKLQQQNNAAIQILNIEGYNKYICI